MLQRGIGIEQNEAARMGRIVPASYVSQLAGVLLRAGAFPREELNFIHTQTRAQGMRPTTQCHAVHCTAA